MHHSNFGALAPGHWSQVQALPGILEGRLHRAEGFASVLQAASSSWSCLKTRGLCKQLLLASNIEHRLHHNCTAPASSTSLRCDLCSVRRQIHSPPTARASAELRVTASRSTTRLPLFLLRLGGARAKPPNIMPRAAFTEGVSDTDPHAALEKVLDEDNLKWVEQQNKVTVDRLGEIRGTKTYERILEALDSKDKIPAAYEIGDKLYNFWQDDQHVQGIWRRASLDSYKSDNVQWETVLDIDALPPPTKDTAKTWVWHGSNLLDDGQFDRCLISLSPGGSDADTTREFCLKTSTFVEGGFEMLEPAKSQVGWRSRDEVLVGTDFDGDGECLTDSGYPRVCRSWKRGTPLSEAKTVFEGEKSDISASQYAYTDHGVAHEFRVRSLTFYTVRARRPGAFHDLRCRGDGVEVARRLRSVTIYVIATHICGRRDSSVALRLGTAHTPSTRPVTIRRRSTGTARPPI